MDLEAGHRLAPLAPDGLAPARRQRAEEIVERGVAGVEPVVLLVLAQQQPLAAHEPPLLLGGEVHPHRRDVHLVAKRDRAGEQHALAERPVDVRADQQARTGHRRERRGDDQLRIVAPAGPLVGVRPAVVEDVFGLAVRLQIDRRDRGHRAGLVAHRQVLRRPAGARRSAAGLLGDVEEVVGHERVGLVVGRGGAGVPGVLADLRDAAVDADLRLQSHQAAKPSKMWLSQWALSLSHSAGERSSRRRRHALRAIWSAPLARQHVEAERQEMRAGDRHVLQLGEALALLGRQPPARRRVGVAVEAAQHVRMPVGVPGVRIAD